MKQYIELGEIVATHGIAGEVKLYPWCDSLEFACKFKKLYFSANGGKAYTVQSRPHKNVALLKIEDVTLVEQARQYIGKVAYINRDDVKLPKGKYFVQDLIGLSVVDANTHKVYGEIKEVTHPGKSDIYHIQSSEGEMYMFPAVDEFLGGIDFEEGIVKVMPIEGMFTNED